MTGYYKHYKTSCFYKILHHATHSESQEQLVVYQSVDNGKVWVRPHDMFFGKVIMNGVEVNRFQFQVLNKNCGCGEINCICYTQK